MPCRYRMLALDLDGTFLAPGGAVSAANLDAVRRAQDAGVRVVVCTGRGYVECAPVLEALGGAMAQEPIITAGGAITADAATGRTLHRFAMDPALVGSVTGTVLSAGHAALVLKDGSDAGYDYLVVTGPGDLTPDPVTVWWFETFGARTRFATGVGDDEHPEHTIRVGMLADRAEAGVIREELRQLYAERTTLHEFNIRVGPEQTGDHEREVTILEAFDAGAGKWPAVERLAMEWGIDRREIAAIGDEMNDEGMIRGAGLGIAMGNAVRAITEAADRVTGRNTEDGVAQAIDRMLSGAW